MNNAKELLALTPKQLKRKLGAPTKYTQNTLHQAIEYLSTYKELGEAVPTREGLALAIGITRVTLDAWLKDEEKAELVYIVYALDSQQARDIITGAVQGEVPPKVAALLLARHGYSEAPKTGSGDRSITVNVDRSCGGVVIDGEKVE